jgi:hypothetical protein
MINLMFIDTSFDPMDLVDITIEPIELVDKNGNFCMCTNGIYNINCKYNQLLPTGNDVSTQTDTRETFFPTFFQTFIRKCKVYLLNFLKFFKLVTV